MFVFLGGDQQIQRTSRQLLQDLAYLVDRACFITFIVVFFVFVPSRPQIVFRQTFPLRYFFDCCSRLVRQSFDSASTSVRLAFDKPSATLRENAEAQANSCRINNLLYSNQSRAVNGRPALHLLTGSPSEWLGCLVWSSAGFILRSDWTPFGAANLSAVQGSMERKLTSEADPKRSRAWAQAGPCPALCLPECVFFP